MESDHFFEWTDKKRIEYVLDKCKSITFQGKLASSGTLLCKSIFNPTVGSIKDLGIIISIVLTRVLRLGADQTGGGGPSIYKDRL